MPEKAARKVWRGRDVIGPAYLFACLLLGGSAQGIWQNMVLQLAGIVIIAWAAMETGEDRLTPSAKQLLLIGLAALAVAALQLIPLPPQIWSHLGPRSHIADGFRVLGQPLPSEPLSLAPSAGLNSLLGFIPPIAMFCAIVRLKAYRLKWLAIALIAATLAGVALGALQVATYTPDQAPWYLYEDTNYSKAVGFFANADHMATLLVVTLPFIAALVAAEKSAGLQRYSAIFASSVGLTIVILIGIALNGSLAGYGLSLPVLGASALIIVPAGNRLRIWIAAAAALLMTASIIVLQTTPIGSSTIGEQASSSVQSRAEILATSSRAIAEFMPFGSGLGSFQTVYPLYERATEVTTTYVIHAHNDYVEVILELGVAGILLLGLFLIWWCVAVWRVWRTSAPNPFARAASIASAAMLIHSLVDFPLRTAAMATCFSMCLGLLADWRSAPAPSEVSDLRRTRHVEFS
jgi:O-antigen ligase